MAEVRVSDSYARAIPQGQPNSAIFVTLKTHATTRLLGNEPQALPQAWLD
jgi:copper(I)-binding protein